MKAYGYRQGGDESSTPMQLTEVTFVTDAEGLRKLATFLNRVAGIMEQNGAAFGHEHFSDFCGGLPKGAPDVIVSK